ncbi:MAG: hypothetical protein HZB70_01195 [Candidatus Berkelbacteria bacterium]|nr:MAG: hypothetical protein HZB70_01195 [Candidatus Berkelbacteria bacterium]QQG52045.1 MAG: hypothetical protein HY845_01800 [Candidatus Berkelbacteria bacterium]
MKNLCTILLVTGIFFVSGCGSDNKATADTREQVAVNRQQEIYVKNQPIPVFDWSRTRDLLIQFYVAQNGAAATWSYITPQMGATVLFETPSQGYPIPMDTQLTNPLQAVWESNSYGLGGLTLAQAEPNGVFTSPNTDATIVMAVNGDGTLSPIYTELKVTTFPFPVRWDKEKGQWVRIEGKEPSIKLIPKAGKGG